MQKQRRPRFGLKDQWREIIRSIEETSYLYTRVNRAISLGLSEYLRRKGVRMIKEGGNFLDAGSGPGDLTRAIMDNHRNSYVVCLDASFALVDIARRRFSVDEKGHIDFVIGIFENPPFRGESFDGIFSAYAIRDSIDLLRAMYSLSRTVKRGGFLIDVDIGKPVSQVFQQFLKLYLDILVPVIASFYYKNVRNPWSKLSRTVEELPPNTILEKIIKKFFVDTKLEEYAFGSMIIASGFKRI